jgi:hypothetical protein
MGYMSAKPLKNGFARRRTALGALAAFALMIWVGPAQLAQARSERTLPYSYERAWPAAVRFLRIDEGFSITESDPDTGYVIFQIKENGRVFSGSLEVVRIEEDGREAVRIVLRIGNRPSYMESGLLTRLAQKLHTDYGDPEPSPDQPEDTPKKGKDGGKQQEEGKKKEKEAKDKPKQ